jgi:hypothetical protein
MKLRRVEKKLRSVAPPLSAAKEEDGVAAWDRSVIRFVGWRRRVAVGGRFDGRFGRGRSVFDGRFRRRRRR